MLKQHSAEWVGAAVLPQSHKCLFKGVMWLESTYVGDNDSVSVLKWYIYYHPRANHGNMSPKHLQSSLSEWISNINFSARCILMYSVLIYTYMWLIWGWFEFWYVLCVFSHLFCREPEAALFNMGPYQSSGRYRCYSHLKGGVDVAVIYKTLRIWPYWPFL